MNDATMQKLEFPLIRECLAGFCGSRLGKRLAQGVTPSTNIQQVREWFQQVREMQAAAESHGLPPMGGVHDIHEQVRAAAKGMACVDYPSRVSSESADSST